MTEFLDVPGGRITYDVTGSGPLLVLSDGIGDRRQAYRFLAPMLAQAGYMAALAAKLREPDQMAEFMKAFRSTSADLAPAWQRGTAPAPSRRRASAKSPRRLAVSSPYPQVGSAKERKKEGRKR